MDIEDFELSIAGSQVFLRPSFELARRVEQAVGAILPFCQKAEAGTASFGDLSRCYQAMVRADPNAPSAKEIDAWVFEEGAFGHKPLAFFLYGLIIGSELLQREFARLQASAANTTRSAEAAKSTGPFEPMAGSTGNS